MSKTQQNISLYKDGNDIYIRIRDCDSSIAELLMTMLGASIKKEIKNISSVPDMPDHFSKEEDVKDKKPEERYSFGPYKGLTPTEVVNKVGPMTSFCYFVKQPIYSAALRNDIAVHVNRHREVLKNRLKQADNATYDDKLTFFKEYDSLFHDKLVKSLYEREYDSIEGFLSLDSVEGTTSLYKEYIESLL